MAKALFEHDAIGVQATVIARLGHEPIRAQITAARRAAHRVVATDWLVPCMFRFRLARRRGR
jgi:hypothetical protein